MDRSSKVSTLIEIAAVLSVVSLLAVAVLPRVVYLGVKNFVAEKQVVPPAPPQAPDAAAPRLPAEAAPAVRRPGGDLSLADPASFRLFTIKDLLVCPTALAANDAAPPAAKRRPM